MAAAGPHKVVEVFQDLCMNSFLPHFYKQQQPEMVVESFFAYLAAVRASSVNESALSKRQQLKLVMFDYQTKPTSTFDLVLTWRALLQRGILLRKS